MKLKYQYERCINHVAKYHSVIRILIFKNHEFKFKMPRSLLF